MDHAGNFSVTDENSTIRNITHVGVVTTLAGSPWQLGSDDCFFFSKDTTTPEIYTVSYTLSLHDALPICPVKPERLNAASSRSASSSAFGFRRSEEHTSELQSQLTISYAVCCLKKKNGAQARRVRATPPSGPPDSLRRATCRNGPAFFFFKGTGPTLISTVSYTLSLHDALPI